MILSASFAFRTLHQLRTEARHHAFSVLFWIAWLMLRLWQRRGGVLGRHDEVLTPFIEFITACIAISIVHRCIHADAPANPETASLTRAIGRGALMLGKVLFLLLGVLMPFIAAESMLWRGFGHDLVQQLALTAGTCLAGGFILVLAATVSAISRARAQALGLAFGVLALIGAATLIVQSMERHGLPWLNSMFEHAMFMRTNSGIIAAMIAFFLCAAGCWLCFVPRRRCWAALLVLLACVQEPLTTSMRQHDWFRGCDWLQRPERHYAGALALHVGTDVSNETAPVQTLWPTLRLSGLRGDEAASIIAFAPIKPLEAKHLWPSETFYTDIPLARNRGDIWAHNDHVRVLMRQAPAATLWLQGSDGKSNDRRWLESDLKPFQLDLAAPQTQKWRLRLAIHGIKPVATLPFRQLWDQSHTFPLQPGLRLECDPLASMSTGVWNLRGRLHLNHSALIASGTHQRIATHDGCPLPPAVILVLHDSELREATVHDLTLSTPGHRVNTPSYDRGYAWQIDSATGFHVQIEEPDAQYQFLHTTREDWIASTTASFYQLEERGTVDLELTTGQMTQVLAELKDTKAQP